MRDRVLRTLLHHYPFLTPRARLLARLPAVPAAPGEVRTRAGVRLVSLPPGQDHVAKSLYWFGDFDPWVGRTLAALSAPGDVVCDVGAHLGDTALPLAATVGPAGRVLAFEPLPAMVEHLCANRAANDARQVEVVQLALSDSTGEVRLSVPEGQPGMAFLATESGVDADSLFVRTVPLDDWLSRSGVREVAVCKIDVEGHEPEVLRGMALALGEHRVGAVVFERHGAWSVRDDVLALFHAHGYRVFQIRKGFVRVHYRETGGPPRGRPTSDYVAVPEGSPHLPLLTGRGR
jgi:FkbM family methyltransferase